MSAASTLMISLPCGEISVQRWHPAEPQLGAVPWLLFHDSLGCNAMWRDFPQQLADATGQLVIGYDRLGFGLSSPQHRPLPLSFIQDEAELVEQLLEQLGLTQFMAFGHSVGGAMAVEVAARLPYDCVALVLEAAQCRVEAQTLAGIRQALAEFAPSANPASAMQRLGKYHGDRAAWVLSAWTDTWLAPAFARWTLDRALAAVTCPTLVLHGDRDEYASPTQTHSPNRARPGDVEVITRAQACAAPRGCTAGDRVCGGVLTVVELMVGVCSG